MNCMLSQDHIFYRLSSKHSRYWIFCYYINMNMFKSYKYNWKQLGVFKLALLSIGAIGGAYFTSFVNDYLILFLVVAIVSSFYIIFVSLNQK